MESPGVQLQATVNDQSVAASEDVDIYAHGVIRRAWRHFIARRNLVLSKALRRLCPPPTPQASVMNAALPLTPVSSSCSEDAHHQHEVLLWMEAIVLSYIQERETFKRYQRQHIRNVRNRRWSIGDKSRPRDVIAFLPQAVVDISHPSGTQDNEPVAFLGFPVEAPPMLSVAPLSSPSSSAPPSGRSTPPTTQNTAVSSPQVSFPPYIIRVSDDQAIRDAVAALRGADSKAATHKDRSNMLSPVLLSPRNYSLSASTHHHREVVRILDIPQDVAALMNRSISGNSSVAEAPSPPLFLDQNDSSDPFLSGRTTAIDEVARSMSFLAPEGSTWPRRGSLPRVSPNQAPDWVRGGFLASHSVKENSGALNVDAAKRFEWIVQPAAYAAARRQMNISHSMNDIVASFDVSEGGIYAIQFGGGGGSRRPSLNNDSGHNDVRKEPHTVITVNELMSRNSDDNDSVSQHNPPPLVEGDVTPVPQSHTPPPPQGFDEHSFVADDCDPDRPPTITVDGFSTRPSPTALAFEAPVHQPSFGSLDEVAQAPPLLVAAGIVGSATAAVPDGHEVADVLKKSPWSTQVLVTSSREETLDLPQQPPLLSIAGETSSPPTNGSFSFVDKHRQSLGRSSLSTSHNNNNSSMPRNAMESYAKRHCQIKPFSSYGALMESAPRRGSPVRGEDDGSGSRTVSPTREGETSTSMPLREKSPLSRSGTPQRVRPTSNRPQSLRERIEEQRRLLKTDPQICGIVDRQVAMLGTLRRGRQPKADDDDRGVRPGSAMSNSEIFVNPSASPARLVTRSFTPAVERTRFVVTSQSRIPPLLRSRVPTPTPQDVCYGNESYSYEEAQTQSPLNHRTSIDKRPTRASLLAPSVALKRKMDILVAKERSALEPTRSIALRIEHGLQQQRPQSRGAERDSGLHSRNYPHALPSHANTQGNLASREDVEWLKRFHATSYY